MKAGFVGLGAMGAGMAANAAAGGYLAQVWNRTRAKADVLARELLVEVAETPEALAASVDVVCICVSADADVIELVERIAPALRAGSVVIDFSTVSPATAAEAAAMVALQGAAFLDSPVSGGVEGARNGTLAMMVGGEDEVLERVRPLLDTMGGSIVHMGMVGSGQGTKAVNQVMAAGINQAVTEALAFAGAQGLDMHKVIQVISSGAAGNWFLQHRGPGMTQGSFSPGFRLRLHHKDLKICQQTAASLDRKFRVIEYTLEDYEQLIEQGCGDEDISSLYRLKCAP